MSQSRGNLADIAKVSAKNSLYLFLGQFSSTFIMAATAILVGRLLGPENYGIYTVALIVPSFLIQVSDLGISSALVSFTARLYSEGRSEEAARLVKTGVVFKILMSIGFGVVLFLLSGSIAANVLKRAELGFFVSVGALYLLGQTTLATLNSVYLGLDRSEIIAFLSNLEAVLKAFATIILLGFGVIGALLGLGLSCLVASGIGILLLWRVLKRISQTNHSRSTSFFEGLRPMLAYGAPIYVLNLLGSLLPLYYGLVLAYFVSDLEIGNYATTMNFSVLATLVTVPLSTSLFPAFSKLSIVKNRASVEKMFKLSVKYTSLIVIPTSIALVLFSRELVYALYGSSFEYAPGYLSLYSLHFLSAGLGALVLGNFFNGQGDTRTMLKVGLITFFMSLLLAPVFTSLYEVAGLIVFRLIAGFTSTILGLYLARRSYDVSIDLSSSLKILVTSILAALPIVIFFQMVPISGPFLRLAVAGPVYFAVFLLMAPLMGAICEEDIMFLRDSTVKLQIVRPLIMRLMAIEEAIIRLKKRVLQEYSARSFVVRSRGL